MKVFLDANILISVLNKEYPLFTFSSRVLSLADSSRFNLYSSPLALGIAFYYAEKASGNAHARHKINLLIEKLNFTMMNETTVETANKNKSIHDLEDGLQYYSAIDSGCKCIVTEDLKDYYFSRIEVLNSQSFLKKYVL